MSFGSWLKKQGSDFRDVNFYFKIGCEVMGPPRGMGGMGTPLERSDRVSAGMKEHSRRLAQERFGSGESHGDRNWSAPVHATQRDGRPVTVSFGRGPRDGETLICDGHVGASEFYEYARDGAKGHDHYLIDGSPANDRGRYSD